jgi:hypothetical protein
MNGLDLQCPENLPLFKCWTDVHEQQEKININKAPGPYDPFMKILKIFANNFAITLQIF